MVEEVQEHGVLSSKPKSKSKSKSESKSGPVLQSDLEERDIATLAEAGLPVCLDADVITDAPNTGRVLSVDAERGDPDTICVFMNASESPWRIDRRSARVLSTGETEEGLDAEQAEQAEQVADLADRAQLVLGCPLEITWCTHTTSKNAREAFVITHVRRLAACKMFAEQPWRIVTLVSNDEGSVAPLAVDALDRALRLEEAPTPSVQATVRRIYARPYRRMNGGTHLGEKPKRGFLMAAGETAKALHAARKLMLSTRRFQRDVTTRLAKFDGADARQEKQAARSGDASVLVALRERQQLVAEAFVMLDQGRCMSLALLAAMESVMGPLPRDCYHTLAALRVSRERRETMRGLRELCASMGTERSRSQLTKKRAKDWDRVFKSLEAWRPLGMDVRTPADGENEAVFAAALDRAAQTVPKASKKMRKEAVRRLVRAARSEPEGHARAVLVQALGGALHQVSGAKGHLADALASSLLRLRRSAMVVGQHLVERTLIDNAEDAFYLHLTELEEALAGEPGAYRARVRLRREDDDRWRAWDAPRRIG